MDTPARHRLRLPIILVINFLVFGIMFACCNPASGKPSGANITICAVDSARAADFPASACGSGAFVAQHGNVQLRVLALDKSGKPMANSQLTITVKGANAASASVTTDSNGAAQYTYQGGHLGTDTISVAPASGGANTARQKSAVVHWIPAGHTVHPLIWVHGIHEDASDFAHELNGTTDNDQASDASEQTFTGLIGALTTTYDPSAMQAFCYVDDPAWTHSPSGCSSAESPQCSSSADCISQSSIDANAVALAQVIQHLSQQFANRKVTLIGYSMGGAIMRTMLAGCLNSSAIAATAQEASDDETACALATALVDHVFIMNGAQEGSWLLTAKRGLDPATLSGAGIPSLANSPFTAVLPLIESAIYAKLKDQLGLDANGAAEQDLTPQSQNILLHNSVQPLPGPDFYSFYGDIQLGVETNYLIYKTPATTLLPLGDLVMLAQADSALATPLWGGAALCDGCPALASGYHQDPSGRYHAWALTDHIVITMNGLVPLLSAPDAASGVQAALNSPVQHLNVSQPGTQDPGSPIQVKDITGLAGGPTTDMSNEIYLIIVHADGLE